MFSAKFCWIGSSVSKEMENRRTAQNCSSCDLKNCNILQKIFVKFINIYLQSFRHPPPLHYYSIGICAYIWKPLNILIQVLSITKIALAKHRSSFFFFFSQHFFLNTYWKLNFEGILSPSPLFGEHKKSNKGKLTKLTLKLKF